MSTTRRTGLGDTVTIAVRRLNDGTLVEDISVETVEVPTLEIDTENRGRVWPAEPAADVWAGR